MSTAIQEVVASEAKASDKVMPELLRILIVHPSTLSGSLIASVLSREADVAVTHWTATVQEALALMDSNRYDVIIVAAALPHRGAIKLTEILAAREPRPKVVVVGVPDSKEVILRYIMAGAAGYVVRGVPAEDLVEGIHAVARNEALVSPEIAAALIVELRRLYRRLQGKAVSRQPYRRLTRREQEVLELIAADYSNLEIARRLRISEGTVKNHVHNILKKLGVNDRQKAVTLWRLFRQPHLGEEIRGPATAMEEIGDLKLEIGAGWHGHISRPAGQGSSG